MVKLRRVAEPAGVAPQDAHAGRVERAHPHLAGHRADQRLDPLAHLVGGLVGEGDGEDGEGADAVLVDEVGDAVREHPGLARTGPGHHQQRAVGVDHGVELVGVQEVGELAGVGGRHGDPILRPGCDTPSGRAPGRARLDWPTALTASASPISAANVALGGQNTAKDTIRGQNTPARRGNRRQARPRVASPTAGRRSATIRSRPRSLRWAGKLAAEDTFAAENPPATPTLGQPDLGRERCVGRANRGQGHVRGRESNRHADARPARSRPRTLR